MSEDSVTMFLSADAETRLELTRDSTHAAALKRFFGSQAFAEYQRLAQCLDRGHLALSAPKNLIFVPGVMGTLLMSRSRGGIWWIDVRTRNQIDQLALAPDGRDDADPNHQIEPVTTDFIYAPFSSACLARDDFGHELFPYDWRKPLAQGAARLRDRIVGLHEQNGRRPVHLIAHSMGGLMVRTTLMAHGKALWSKVGRIVFIGTPHYGAPAIAGYLKNHLWGFEILALLGRYLSRETFRSMWGVLGLLPAPRGIYPGTRENDRNPWQPEDTEDAYVHPCANFDLYRAESWALGLSEEATARLQRVLDATAEQHRRLDDWHRSLNQEQRDRMLVIAGVGYKTLFRLAYATRFFGLWEHTVKSTTRVPGDSHRDGDGRVPRASAALEWVPVRYVRGVHGGLTNIPAVYQDVFRWLKEEPLQLPDTPASALSSHLGADNARSDTPHLDGSARIKPFSDDPGLWDVETPDPQRLAVLDAELAADRLPEFTRVRLL